MNITLGECSIYDKKVAAEWNGIYRTNPLLNFFASYDFNHLFIQYFHKSKSRRSMKPVIISAVDEKRGTLMFLPLAKSHGHYYMLWERSSVPYCDAVYRSDITKEELDYIFDHLSEVLGNETIYFTKMSEVSAFTEYLHERFTPYKKKNYGAIELLRTYGYTYKLINKECRENIEEASERINNEGLVYRTDIYFEKALPSRAVADINMIIHGEKQSLFSKMKSSSRSRNSAVIKSVKKGMSSIAVISYIDDYPVACLYGFMRGKTLSVISLSSTRYGVSYSSKHLIVSDLIKYCTDKLKLEWIDFCRLDDNIKNDFQSKKRYVYNFEIKL